MSSGRAGAVGMLQAMLQGAGPVGYCPKVLKDILLSGRFVPGVLVPGVLVPGIRGLGVTGTGSPGSGSLGSRRPLRGLQSPRLGCSLQELWATGCVLRVMGVLRVFR